MSDRHVPAEGEPDASVGVEYATILNVRAVPNGDEVIVSPHYTVEPDAGIVLQHHGADDRSVIRNPIVAASNDFWVADNATVIGSVELEHNASVWFNSVVRGD